MPAEMLSILCSRLPTFFLSLAHSVH